jgi:hypothetical protein
VVQVDDDIIDQLGPVTSQLVLAGTRQRDERGFNRFRLILVCKQPDSIAEEAMAVFDSLGVNKRVHLHIIGETEFPVRHDYQQ